MCGIGGILLTRPVVPDGARLAAMADAMSFRGPDDAGVWAAPHVGLVHRRLSVRDLSPAGHCPMASDDGVLQLVFNGEIYNWRELRQALEEGKIMPSRYDSYLRLYEKSAQIKEWELK